MKNYTYIITLLFCSCFINSVLSQDAELLKAKGIINKVKNFYDHTAKYKIAVGYTLYKSSESMEQMEAYQGVVVKRNKDFYTKTHNTETLQVSDKLIRVNHDEKAIAYHQIQPEEKNIAGINLEALLQSFEKATIEEEGANYKITLLTPAISQSPYGVVVLEIEKKKYTLKKQTLFFANKIPVTFDDGTERYENPRLEIIFNNFSENIAKYDPKFKIASYMVVSNSGNRPSKALKNYQIIDTKRQ